METTIEIRKQVQPYPPHLLYLLSQMEEEEVGLWEMTKLQHFLHFVHLNLRNCANLTAI
jgi:hypothetical protein